MAFHLNPELPVAEELKRVLREEMEAAAQQLRTAAQGNGDDAIHEARKSVKKIRATLRLVQANLDHIYAEKNAEFGEIGRTLSELRDAAAMLETYDELRKHYQDQVDEGVWTALRRLLMKRKRETEKAVSDVAVFRHYPQQLDTTAKQVDSWPLRGKQFDMIEPGLAKAFRRGRQAMKRAQKNPSPEHFHEWRKRVKDHWYHMRLLRPIWADMMDAYGGVLKDMQTWLGDDHNLAVLRETIGDDQSLSALVPVIEQHQARLRERASLAGVRVYGVKPRQMAGTLEFLWNSPAERTEGAEP